MEKFNFNLKESFDKNSLVSFAQTSLESQDLFAGFETRNYFIFYGFSGTGKDSFLDLIKKDNEYFDLLVKVPSHTTKRKSSEDRKGEFIYVDKKSWNDEDYFFVYENEKKIKYGYKKEDVLKIWNSFTINPFVFKVNLSRVQHWKFINLPRIPVFIVKESEIKRLNETLFQVFGINSENQGHYFNFINQNPFPQDLLGFKIHFRGDVEKLKKIIQNHKSVHDTQSLEKLLEKELENSNARFFYDGSSFSHSDEEIDMLIDGDFLKDISVSEKSKNVRLKVKRIIKRFINDFLIPKSFVYKDIVYFDYDHILQSEEFQKPDNYLIKGFYQKNLYLNFSKSPLFRILFLTWLPWDSDWETKQLLFKDLWKTLKILQRFTIFNGWNKISENVKLDDYFTKEISFKVFMKNSPSDIIKTLTKHFELNLLNENFENKIAHLKEFSVVDKHQKFFSDGKEFFTNAFPLINNYIGEIDEFSKNINFENSQILKNYLWGIKSALLSFNSKIDDIFKFNNSLNNDIEKLDSHLVKSLLKFQESIENYHFNDFDLENLKVYNFENINLLSDNNLLLFDSKLISQENWKNLSINENYYSIFDFPENLESYIEKFNLKVYQKVFDLINQLKTLIKKMFNYLDEQGKKLFIFEYSKNSKIESFNYENFDFLKFLKFNFGLDEFYEEFLKFKK